MMGVILFKLRAVACQLFRRTPINIKERRKMKRQASGLTAYC